MAARVSLNMIVRDEAGTLGRCLESVAGLFDEVVVVDTGSTDGTPEIAARHGATVHPVAWAESFADARNAALDRSAGDWIFWIDGDEWLDEQGRATFRTLIDGLGDENAVYFLRQLSPIGEHGEEGRLCVSQPRLFRRDPRVRWKYRVHEQILPGCLARGAETRQAEVDIQHSGYVSRHVSKRKEERNLRLLELERAERPGDPWVLFQLARVYPPERFEEAERLLRNVLERVAADDPLVRQSYALLFKRYDDAGRSERAREIMTEALSRYPNDTRLLVEAGLFAYRGEDLEFAERAFRALLARGPDAEEFLGAVDLSHRGWQARHNLAVVRHRQGKLGEAEALWRQALADAPTASPLLNGLAEILLTQGRRDELGPMLDAMEKLGEDVAYLRARALFGQRAFGQARAVLDELVVRRPGTIDHARLLARCCILLRDYDAAETALGCVLEIDPEDAEACETLAMLQGDEDDMGAAV